MIPFVLILIFGAVLARWQITSRRITRLHQYETAAKLFYERAQPLVDDSDTPNEILDMIAFLNREITDKKASATLRHALMQLVASGKKIQAPAWSEDFFARRPELHQPYVDATAAALIAVTYNAGAFSGRLTRRAIALVTLHNEVAPSVASDFRRAARERVDGDGPLAQPA